MSSSTDVDFYQTIAPVCRQATVRRAAHDGAVHELFGDDLAVLAVNLAGEPRRVEAPGDDLGRDAIDFVVCRLHARRAGEREDRGGECEAAHRTPPRGGGGGGGGGGSGITGGVVATGGGAGGAGVALEWVVVQSASVPIPSSIGAEAVPVTGVYE